MDDAANNVETSSASRLVELRASAKGWHGVQLAVLGFIGLCGVLQGAAGQDGPHWLQVIAGVLVLARSRAGLPRDRAGRHGRLAGARARGRRAGGRLVEAVLHHTARGCGRGIAITFVAVVRARAGCDVDVVAAAGSSSDDAGLVEVTTSDGAACGTLQDGNLAPSPMRERRSRGRRHRR